MTYLLSDDLLAIRGLLGTPVAMATKRKPSYNHEYGVFGRDRLLAEDDQSVQALGLDRDHESLGVID